MKTLPLVGYKAFGAMQAFHKLMLGLKFLPAYVNESYENFFERVTKMETADRENIIREAALFVPLYNEEIDALLSFASDANGMPIGPENIKNFGPDHIHEMVVAVCVEISKIKVSIVSEDEKKNSHTSQSISGG